MVQLNSLYCNIILNRCAVWSCHTIGYHCVHTLPQYWSFFNWLSNNTNTTNEEFHTLGELIKHNACSLYIFSHLERDVVLLAYSLSTNWQLWSWEERQDHVVKTIWFAADARLSKFATFGYAFKPQRVPTCRQLADDSLCPDIILSCWTLIINPVITKSIQHRILV